MSRTPQMTTDLLFRLLSDPIRRSLVERMRNEGEIAVHSLADRVPISQPAVSRHLARLREAGLVKARAAGRETFYSVSPSGLAPLADWLETFGPLAAAPDPGARRRPA